MATRNLFLGLKAWQLFNPPASASDTTTGTRFDPAFTDSAVTAGLGSDITMQFRGDDGAVATAVAGETLSVRADVHTSVSNITQVWRLDGPTGPLIRANLSFDNNLTIQHNTGSLASPSWTTIGTVAEYWANNARRTLNIILTIGVGNNHTIEVLRDGGQIFLANFTNANITNDGVQFLGFRASGSGGSQFGVSQVFVATDRDLLGSHVYSLHADGAGSNSGMTGAFTDVNKVIESTTSIVSSDTAGQRTTFSIEDLPALPANTQIGGFSRHTFQARADGSPGNIRSVIRQGGVDTVSGDIAGVSSGFQTFHIGYDLSVADINAAGFELGWESAA